jgi:cytidine deaminase
MASQGPGEEYADESPARSVTREGGRDIVEDARAEGPDAVDWALLHRSAVDHMRRAYAPYSRFPVGVAGLVDDGRVVVGCNVENAAYGVGLCAECGMVSHLLATGGGRLVAVYCVGADGAALMPCGRCRQLLWEHGGPDCRLMTPQGVLTMREVLPLAFGPDTLAARGHPA